MGRVFAVALSVAMVAAVPVAAQRFVVEGPPPSSDAAAPQPPAGAAVGFVPPERDEAGYRTPNRDLAPEEAVWHVRAALNVAALSCRGTGDEEISGAYNMLLAAERAPLAAAAAGTQARYRTRVGDMWEARYDDDMTRLYNFFAQPAAHRGFCAAAATLLHEAQAVSPEAFPGFAGAALPRLEAPFVAFFAAYDDYRGALATWRQRHAPLVIATAAPVPVGPRLGPDAD